MWKEGWLKALGNSGEMALTVCQLIRDLLSTYGAVASPDENTIAKWSKWRKLEPTVRIVRHPLFVSSPTYMRQSHVKTVIIYKLGFNQYYYTFTSILLIRILLCSKFSWTKFINYKCFGIKSCAAAGGMAALFKCDDSGCVVQTCQIYRENKVCRGARSNRARADFAFFYHTKTMKDIDNAGTNRLRVTLFHPVQGYLDLRLQIKIFTLFHV